MEKVILKDRWLCPADKCTLWTGNKLGCNVKTYQNFYNKLWEWKEAKSRSKKAMKKTTISGLFEVTKRLIIKCNRLMSSHQEQSEKLKTVSEDHHQQIKGLKAQINKLLQDSSRDADIITDL